MTGHWMEILWALGAVLLLLVAALGVGRWCDGLWRDLVGLGRMEGLALRFLAGTGALSLAVFLIGQVHFSSAVSGVVLTVSAVFGLRVFKRDGDGKLGATAPLLLAGAIVVVCGISGLDRPIGDINADEISYHLLGPSVWLREKRIVPVVEEALTAFPATVEVLLAVVRSISNDRAPGVVGALFLGALVLQVRGLARRLGASERGANLAAALFAAMPAATATVDRCFVDVPYAAFTCAAARLAFDASCRRHLAVAGAFAGFAAGTKYFGLPVILLVALLLVLFRPAALRGRWTHAPIFLLAASLAGGAWYLRNWIVLGNPIYPPPPLLWSFLPTPTFSLEAAARLQAYIAERGQGLGHGLNDLLRLPFRLTYRTAWFHGGGGIGLAPLAFGPIALAVLWRQRVARAWAVLAALLTLFWFLSDQEIRFLDPALAVFAAFAGLGGETLLQRPARVGRLLAIAVAAVSLLLGGVLTVLDRADRLLAVFSPTRSAARYEQGVPHRAAFAFLNERAEVRKVFVTNPFVPVYYLAKEYTVARGRWGEQPHPGIRSVADAVGAIRDLGVTHVLDVNYYGAGFAWPETGFGRLVHEEKDLRIHAVGQ